MSERTRWHCCQRAARLRHLSLFMFVVFRRQVPWDCWTGILAHIDRRELPIRSHPRDITAQVTFRNLQSQRTWPITVHPPPANAHTLTGLARCDVTGFPSSLSDYSPTHFARVNTLTQGSEFDKTQSHTQSTNGRLVTCLISDRVDLCVSFSGHRLLVGLMTKGLVAFVLSCVSVSGRARKLHVTGWNVLGTNVNKCFWN